MDIRLEYQVKTSTFEGPLELLLDLIEKRKLFINEISLAQITDDYVAHLRTFETLSPDAASSFLIVASTLVLIKSKSLIPSIALTPEETGDIQELEERLRQYQRVRELSLHIRERFGKEILFPQGQVKVREVHFSPTPEITKSGVLTAIRNILANLPKEIPLPQAVVKKVISLEEMMERITARITSSLKVNFNEVAGVGKEKTEKVDIIVSFLAMLELVKQGVIAVTQERHGADILMETHVLDTPRYGESV